MWEEPRLYIVFAALSPVPPGEEDEEEGRSLFHAHVAHCGFSEETASCGTQGLFSKWAEPYHVGEERLHTGRLENETKPVSVCVSVWFQLFYCFSFTPVISGHVASKDFIFLTLFSLSKFYFLFCHFFVLFVSFTPGSLGLFVKSTFWQIYPQ